jgi:CheY-like chemotaxis protein
MTVIQGSGRVANAPRSTDLANLRLLLMVRDSASARRYHDLFEVFGVTVMPVHSATDLFKALREHHPDIVACDVDLPHETGMHLIKRIRMRSRLEGGGTPAIGFCDKPTQQAHTKALLAGFQAFVSAEPMDVLLAVSEVLGERSASN